MMKPIVSVVVEAYNEEHNALMLHFDTLEAIYRQDFPLDQVELVLIGSSHQIEGWRTPHPAWQAFFQVRLVPVDPENSYYWQLKNQGAEAAEGEFVAFLDSDVSPGPRWLSSVVKGLQNGADVVVGPSMYRAGQLGPDSPWMLAAALPSWGFMLARNGSAQKPQAGALLAHNVAMRRALLLAHPFRMLRRSFSSTLLYRELVRAGAKVAFQPDQRVAHAVQLRWWLFRRHFRTGWETYDARRIDPAWPRIPALERLKFIEPILLRMGLVCRDACHWFPFSRIVGVPRTRAIFFFPLVMLASVAARFAEMAGMYAALIAPKTTEHQARF
ncbi:MAG TPA: glycosyltransferase family 2 protein [Bryobacteraceae bacterium]|nr:glycosyltransferase family 2 protein [Bryobacteraceae bacterium]HXJ42188.1 glycosyltransferase family 2 protein [Bryobacteraceae bacterium]